jgi:ribose/xylose/arabinose/galactoside ABC-type transport system permease subunit
VDLVSRLAPLVFLVTLVIVFGTLEPRFLSKLNLLNVLRQVSITGLIAVGMTYVILTSGIDLSVGSLLALAVW